MEMQVGRSIVLRALSVARHRTIVEEHGASRPARAAQLNYKWFCAALGNSKTSLLSTWKHIPARAHATTDRGRAPAHLQCAPLLHSSPALERATPASRFADIIIIAQPRHRRGGALGRCCPRAACPRRLSLLFGARGSSIRTENAAQRTPTPVNLGLAGRVHRRWSL